MICDIVTAELGLPPSEIMVAGVRLERMAFEHSFIAVRGGQNGSLHRGDIQFRNSWLHQDSPAPDAWLDQPGSDAGPGIC